MTYTPTVCCLIFVLACLCCGDFIDMLFYLLLAVCYLINLALLSGGGFIDVLFLSSCFSVFTSVFTSTFAGSSEKQY